MTATSAAESLWSESSKTLLCPQQKQEKTWKSCRVSENKEAIICKLILQIKSIVRSAFDTEQQFQNTFETLKETRVSIMTANNWQFLPIWNTLAVGEVDLINFIKFITKVAKYLKYHQIPFKS